MKEERNDFGHLKEKINYFKKNNSKIHIVLKNEQFYNGFIIEESADFFIMNDLKLGKTPIFYLEIKVIEPYKPKENHI